MWPVERYGVDIKGNLYNVKLNFGKPYHCAGSDTAYTVHVVEVYLFRL